MQTMRIKVCKSWLVVYIAGVSLFSGFVLPTLLYNAPYESDDVRAYSYEALPLGMNMTEFQRKMGMNYSQFEQLYFSPRNGKVNPINYSLIINGSRSICGKSPPYLLVVVPSIPDHFARRDAIRKTYGSFAEGSVFHKGLRKKLGVTVNLIFVLGRARSDIVQTLIGNEHKQYQDIVQGNFTDTYSNLTIKMLFVLKWISVRCSRVKYVLKIDEDVFVNIPNLINLTQSQTYDERGTIIGKIHVHHRVLRFGKWAVSYTQYPLTHYPSYAAGNAYVISGNIIPKLFNCSEYMPYLSIEDAFITGVLGHVIGARKVDVTGFTWWDKGSPSPCGFFEHKRYTGNRISLAKMYKMWGAYISHDVFCRDLRGQFISAGMSEMYMERVKPVHNSKDV